MKYTILTLFPEIIDAYFTSSIMAKALDRGMMEYRAVNIRDYAYDKHRACDDAPYGGGAGMLMLAEPLGRALDAAGAAGKPKQNSSAPSSGESSDTARPRVIYLSPSGRPFNQALARELAAEKELVLICGRYEGIDQRIIETYADDEISVGDYVLSSGEVAALVLIDAVYHLVEQVITPASLEEESFSGGLLEYPQYTRPEIYGTLRVPEVLLSGHHENIRRWRLEKRVEKTLALRPDLIRLGEECSLFDDETRKIIEQKAAEAARGSDERD
jgi:tRNA (guanine37-N1)-methyltransferase